MEYPNVPAGWRSSRLKFVATINDEALSENTTPDRSIKYVDIGDVASQGEIIGATDYKFGHAPSRARRKVRDGDVIVSTVRTYLRAIAAIRDPDPDTIVSTGFAVIRPRELDPAFAAYALRASYFVDEVVAASTGVSYPAINSSALGNIAVLVPPLSTQRAIAAFLDRETAKIDTLVEKKRRLLDLLDEQRTALITHAVTRGLDPDVPMKDSGVEWLGEIPAHWDATKTKFVAKLRTGHTPSRQHPEYWDNTTVPWFGLADVWQIRDGTREYVSETKEKVSELGLAHSSAVKLPAGTVILSRTASVGFSAISATEMATTQDFVNWIPGERILPEYLLYVFRAMRQELKRLTMGSTHQTIYMPDVASFSTPVPPLSEQEAIISHIRGHALRVDVLSQGIRQAISLSEEYRTALISGAVTGLIEV